LTIFSTSPIMKRDTSDRIIIKRRPGFQNKSAFAGNPVGAGRRIFPERNG
jgi:hypothetical protein